VSFIEDPALLEGGVDERPMNSAPLPGMALGDDDHVDRHDRQLGLDHEEVEVAGVGALGPSLGAEEDHARALARGAGQEARGTLDLLGRDHGRQVTARACAHDRIAGTVLKLLRLASMCVITSRVTHTRRQRADAGSENCDLRVDVSGVGVGLMWEPQGPMEKMRFLPLVKAYPALSSTYGEVTCVAGIEVVDDTPTGLIRLYPIPFRSLEDEQQFRKYEFIELEVQAHSGDRRPETRRPNRDSIKTVGPVLSSERGWRQRRLFVEPVISGSMCELLRHQQADGTSLGIFRPREVLDLVIEQKDVDADKRQIAEASAAQGSLLDRTEQAYQQKAIEQIPYAFKYRYLCSVPDCRSHTQTIIDWEIVQLYRNVRGRPDWQKQMRAKWIAQLCAPDRDTAFIVGNQHQYPNAFLVLGVWWPPLEPEQLALG
jgi:hypothetical protein